MTKSKHIRDRNRSLLERFMNFVRSDWQWTGSTNGHGYGRFSLNGKHEVASRVSYELFNGPIPEGMDVLHSCDDPGCVDPEHLHIGDQLKNMRERKERGREPCTKGEANGRSKLTELQVIEIRRLVQEGISQTELARQYGINKTKISSIIRRETWGHLL